MNIINAPAISSVVGKGNPFKLTITGTNFHQVCLVKIEGNEVWTIWKSATQVLAKSVRYYVPKGKAVQITVTNLDENLTSAPFTFTR